jgi:DNA helicase II / ATP-dependent DNA helicase PcrA
MHAKNRPHHVTRNQLFDQQIVFKTLTTMPSPATYPSRIITTTARRITVLASPGSGKTTTLIGRVHHLIETGVPAAQILVLSHSKATVRELRRRMDSSTLHTRTLSQTTNILNRSTDTSKPDLSGVSVKTAHGYALSLIHVHDLQHPTGLPRARVLDKKHTLQLLTATIAQTRTRCRKGLLWPLHSRTTRTARLDKFDTLAQSRNTSLFAQLLAYTHTAKIGLLDGVKLPPFQALTPYIKLLKPINLAFAANKKALGFIDFNDMQVKALQVIAACPALVTHTHVLVDEYQDSSAAQIKLLTALATLPRRSIMVFADPSQAIYGFSGSRYIPLGSVLDKVKTLQLPVSHRLSAPVAALATAVAKHSSQRSIATSHSGPAPQLIVNTNLASQTARVVADIKRLLAGGALSSQIAVLARTKALLQPVEAALLATNINTTRLGINRTLCHALRVLRLVRLVERHVQAHTITLDTLQTALSKLGIATVDSSRCKTAVRELVKAASLSLEGRYRVCCDVYMRLKSGVRADPELRAELSRWGPLCRKFCSTRMMRGALQALPSDHLVTGTVHAAKGMEWAHVLIVGVADGQIPSYLAKTDTELKEERRILYVAISRARQTLSLYHAPVAHARSRKRFEQLSRFLSPAKVRATYRRTTG